MNPNDIRPWLEQRWNEDIVARLVEYVRVPARSPVFDEDWARRGELAAVVREAHRWASAQSIDGAVFEIVELPGRTPCLFFDCPATQGVGNASTVLFYGHLDKQPEMSGWRADLGPYTPKIEHGRLYGRGSADDGYALYASIAVIGALDAQRIARPRCVGLIETSEESGSPDLPAYLQALKPRLGDVRLVCALDSGCGNYDQLWVTTSLRGLAGGTLTVEILQQGVHSGAASGIVPSSFRIARKLLDRLDDVDTGHVKLQGLHADIPAERITQAGAAGAILGDTVWTQYPWSVCDHVPQPKVQGAAALRQRVAHDAAGRARASQSGPASASEPGPKSDPKSDPQPMAQPNLQSNPLSDPQAASPWQHAQPTTKDPVQALLNRTWRPALSVTGAAHLPSLQSAGNVLRPRTALQLSMRLPPTVDADAATALIRRTLEADPPYQARVTFEPEHAASGWNAPSTAPWLAEAIDDASRGAFGPAAGWIGEGGTIPFMNMLGEDFPEAQFLITGVLGPHSNAHGPDEFLNIDFARRLSVAVASIVADLARQPAR